MAFNTGVIAVDTTSYANLLESFANLVQSHYEYQLSQENLIKFFKKKKKSQDKSFRKDLLVLTKALAEKRNNEMSVIQSSVDSSVSDSCVLSNSSLQVTVSSSSLMDNILQKESDLIKKLREIGNALGVEVCKSVLEAKGNSPILTNIESQTAYRPLSKNSDPRYWSVMANKNYTQSISNVYETTSRPVLYNSGSPSDISNVSQTTFVSFSDRSSSLNDHNDTSFMDSDSNSSVISESLNNSLLTTKSNSSLKINASQAISSTRIDGHESSNYHSYNNLSDSESNSSLTSNLAHTTSRLSPHIPVSPDSNYLTTPNNSLLTNYYLSETASHPLHDSSTSHNAPNGNWLTTESNWLLENASDQINDSSKSLESKALPKQSTLLQSTNVSQTLSGPLNNHFETPNSSDNSIYISLSNMDREFGTDNIIYYGGNASDISYNECVNISNEEHNECLVIHNNEEHNECIVMPNNEEHNVLKRKFKQMNNDNNK